MSEQAQQQAEQPESSTASTPTVQRDPATMRHYLDRALSVLDHTRQVRRDRMARGAPVGPEIHQYRNIVRCSQDLRFEIVQIYVENQ